MPKVAWDYGRSEQASLNALVDKFARQMKAALAEKLAAGYHDWDDPTMRMAILARLRKHLRRENMNEVAIANLAAMLWNLRPGKSE